MRRTTRDIEWIHHLPLTSAQIDKATALITGLPPTSAIWTRDDGALVMIWDGPKYSFELAVEAEGDVWQTIWDDDGEVDVVDLPPSMAEAIAWVGHVGD